MPTAWITDMMNALRNADKSLYKARTEYFLREFGYSKPCNRFAGGNVNEYLVRDLLVEQGYQVEVLTNNARVDMKVVGVPSPISLKYSSGGDIKLHNSMNTLNKDVEMANSLLTTPKEWWFLSKDDMLEVGVDVTSYIKNTSDGAALKASVLTALRKKNYPHMFPFALDTNKETCKGRDCAEIMYEYIKAQVPSA